jgi:SagB-type dehydrogenase family enzyme
LLARLTYRLNPLLLIYSARIGGDRRLLAETRSSSPPLVLHDAHVAWALTALPAEFDLGEVHNVWSRVFKPELIELLWQACLDEGLIAPVETKDQTIVRFDAWDAFGWSEAAIFHESTRDYPFIKMDEPDAFEQDRKRMVSYVEEASPPSIYQSFKAEHSVSLGARLSLRDSARRILQMMSPEDRRGLAGLGLFFDICFGQRDLVDFDVQGAFLRKAIPSGGARHPTEIFFAAFPRSPLPPGIYHYNVEHHRLDCIRSGDHEASLRKATFDLFQKFKRQPLGLVVFTSLVERAMWRYRDARSSRAILVDVGHALMAYRTVANAIGFDTYTYQKIRDDFLCQEIGIDRLRQVPLFVGTLV